MKTFKEISTALLAGKQLTDNTGSVIQMDTSGELFQVNGQRLTNLDIRGEWKIHQPWYLDIPIQGVLCWVTDNEDADLWCPAVVIKYKENAFIKFITWDACAKYAKPMTPKDIQEYYGSNI